MTIHLPKDVENSIEAAIHGGLFASVDDALAEAWRCLQRQQTASQAKLIDTGSVAAPRLEQKPIWEVVDELRKSVPPEEFSQLPKDGAEQLDHYLYGSPKRPRA